MASDRGNKQWLYLFRGCWWTIIRPCSTDEPVGLKEIPVLYPRGDTVTSNGNSFHKCTARHGNSYEHDETFHEERNDRHGIYIHNLKPNLRLLLRSRFNQRLRFTIFFFSSFPHIHF